MFTSMPNPDLYSPLARIIDDEETVRNSEAFMLRMGGINAVIVGNYLTTLGRPAEADLELLDDLQMPIKALNATL